MIDELNYEKRNLMFSMISPIEFDLKTSILNTVDDINFSIDMIAKIENRLKKKNEFIESNKIRLDVLDLSDFVAIVNKNIKYFKTNVDTRKNFNSIFELLIPIRNNVVHSKPIQIADYPNLKDIFFLKLNMVSFIDWKKTNEIRNKLINNDESAILQCRYFQEFNPNIKSNLPAPEFDDTGFIGRKKEVDEIIDLIINSKHQIISVVGAGGLGKTATVVNCLYKIQDILDNPFKRIIWTSLKTEKLTNGEFEKINNIIANLDGIYEQSKYILGINMRNDNSFELLKKLEEIPSILVIDNLETMIIDKNVIDFLKQIPENCKVVITSRDGIGQLENRYDFYAMSEEDCISYYRELAKYLNVSQLYKKCNADIISKVEQLNYSPLAIKWYITNVANGGNLNILIHNQAELLEFCLSNVYEKLSDNSKILLSIMQIEKKPLSYGELLFFSELENIQSYLNELSKTYMVSRNENDFIISDMTLKYLNTKQKITNEIYNSIKDKRRRLNGMIQDVRINVESDPYNPKSLKVNMNDVEEVVAAYYINEIFHYNYKKRENRQKVIELLNKAKKIKPDYYEIYKIEGYINSGVNNFLADESYRTSILYSRNNEEKAYCLFMYATFYAINDIDPLEAENMIEEVEKILGNTFEIEMAKTRIFMYNGKFEKCEELFNGLFKKLSSINSKVDKNKLYKLYADYCRRRAEKIHRYDIEEKINWLIKGIDIINQSSYIDFKLYIVLAQILRDISVFYYNDVAMNTLLNNLKLHRKKISEINHYKFISRNILTNKEKIKKHTFDDMKEYLDDYKNIIPTINNNNYGIVVGIKDYYGFIANYNNDSIYFLQSHLNYDNIDFGDYVKFELYNNEQGIAAKNIFLISRTK